MQKWEYRSLIRWRGWKPYGHKSMIYDEFLWLADKWAPEDFSEKLTEWGNDGWELVAISPRSSHLGKTEVNTDAQVAGFTNEELWVFKRPIP